MIRRVFALVLVLVFSLMLSTVAVAGSGTQQLVPTTPGTIMATIPTVDEQRAGLTFWWPEYYISRMISGAREVGGNFIQVGTGSPQGIRANTLRPVASAGMRVEADTICATTGATDVRLVIDQPVLVNRDILVSGWVGGAEVDRVREYFNRFFRNAIQVVHMDHTGGFGQTVRIAARVNLDGMEINQLAFYSFDWQTNVARRIAHPNYSIDGEFVWFSTDVGDFVIISSAPLVRR